ncbi:Major facilitator superfamily domain general substrate transporter [Penicillium lagena]|uniref:Major facilitator superfamily domain general substrate transporter n=1 Tax=Penicillium lagena TaxID=94218 RepID=UPI0025400328|nr:Major facilitator superfamily domain general substrate transporter [Penicillium lagena]KAJ5601527.1 Major facilitator superfamily domain general substrate transporter [Penicillium lagena]
MNWSTPKQKRTIPVMGYTLALVFPIYVDPFKKDTTDLHHNTEANVTVQVGKDMALEEGNQSKPEPQQWRRSMKLPEKK